MLFKYYIWYHLIIIYIAYSNDHYIKCDIERLEAVPSALQDLQCLITIILVVTLMLHNLDWNTLCNKRKEARLYLLYTIWLMFLCQVILHQQQDLQEGMI